MRGLCRHRPPRQRETSSLHLLVAVAATFTPTTMGSLTRNLNAPHRPQHHLTRPRAWGFGSIRILVTACRRRVAPLMLQFPPTHPGRNECRTAVGAAFSPGRHIRRPTRAAAPLPRPQPQASQSPAATAETLDSTRYSVETKSDQLNSLKLSQTDPQRTRIHA